MEIQATEMILCSSAAILAARKPSTWTGDMALCRGYQNYTGCQNCSRASDLVIVAVFGHNELCGPTTTIFYLWPLKCCGLWPQETVAVEDRSLVVKLFGVIWADIRGRSGHSGVVTGCSRSRSPLKCYAAHPWLEDVPFTPKDSRKAISLLWLLRTK